MIKEYILATKEENKIRIEVIHSKRKTIGIEIKGNDVKARVPMRLSDQEVIQFITGHEEWIKEKLIQNRQKKQVPLPPVKKLTNQEIEDMKITFLKLVDCYAKKMDVSYGNITIRNQKTRWGSCSSKGNLNFNYQLFFLERELMEYVVVHELAHRRHMNHSKDFWEEVNRYFPEYERCRSELRQIRIRQVE